MIRSLRGVIIRSMSGSSSAPVKTSLFDYHVDKGGKMVDFAGFMLPVLYSADSITSSHVHTRNHCSVFDVSHMLQTKIHGTDRKELIERLTPGDMKSLNVDKATLTVFTDESGGILDDLIVTNSSEGYIYMVTNAGRREHDIQHLRKAVKEMKDEKKDVELEFLEMNDVSLIAVQGPEAVRALQPLTSKSIDQLPFMSSAIATVGGVQDCRITRCGYTGEDGFEISVRSSDVASLVDKLTQSNQAKVKLAGLGARDSLRLEAGLCLYGSDIDSTTSPVEASLSWLLPKSRRQSADFPGASVICRQVKEGVSRRRVGLILVGGPPARHGAEVFNAEQKVGEVTSGGPSPTLGYNIAMAYVETSSSKVGTQIDVRVRGKSVKATVVKMPFVPTKYFVNK